MSELAWVAEAREHIGLAEVAGKQHNGTIVNWLIKLGAWWRGSCYVRHRHHRYQHRHCNDWYG